ncbi:MAG: Hsp20/alpha crystallin family protein [Gammaproteobacteria bacterium]
MSLIPKNSMFDMDTFFNDSFPAFRLLPAQGDNLGNVAVDIHELNDRFTVEADFPGFDKEDIDINVDNNVLTISATHKDEKEQTEKGRVIRKERRVGTSARSFNLGKNIDESKIKAEFKAGVLTVSIPKADVAPATKKITIS